MLGANGAGKTTTMMTIAGEIPPLQGEVRLFGEKVTTPDVQADEERASATSPRSDR